MNNVFLAITLTALAGLSTGIGGLLAFVSKGTNRKFLAFTLGISAGVMLYVSFMELLTKAISVLGDAYGEKSGMGFAVLWFFSGMLIAAIIDRFIPETPGLSELSEAGGKTRLMRTGVVTAVALAVHNFPEGMATFMSALNSPALALPIVCAIAIHNIPEGIAVAIPVYFATGSKIKGFWYSFISGIAEPFGAVVGYLLLMPFINDLTNAYVFACVAGVMVFISVDELLPSANEYSENHLAVYGLVAGMVVMAISLIAFI